MRRRSAILAFAASFALTPAASQAAGACPGPRASAGTSVHGPVLLIPDNARLCVALTPSPSTWLQVRISRPAATRSTLMAAAFAKTATCLIGPDGTGDCLIEGRPLAQAMRRVETAPTLAAWR